MQKEILQRLMGVHNMLFGMSVAGDAVVPMAQVLMTLNGVIGEMAQALGAEIPASQSDADTEEAAHE